MFVKVLAFVMLGTVRSGADVIICRISDFDSPICVIDLGYEYESDCCLQLSHYTADSNLCISYLKSTDFSMEYDSSIHECDGSAKIKVLRRNSSSHISRALQVNCGNPITINFGIYSSVLHTYPILLSRKINGKTKTLFVIYELQVSTSFFKYTASISGLNTATAYQFILLNPGPLNRKCYKSTDLTGTAFINDYNTSSVTLTGATSISCSFIGYYVPTQDGLFKVSTNMDSTTDIWIGDNIDTKIPSISCISGVPCSHSINAVAGKAYQIYIKASKSSSNTINIAEFQMNNLLFVYNQSDSESRTTRPCNNWILQHFNKVFNGVYYCPIGVYKCNLIDSDNRYLSALIPKYCSNYSWILNDFACTACIQNAHIEGSFCICDSGFAENHTEGKCVSDGYRLEINLYRKVVDTSIFDVAFLIITNPCTQPYKNWFCKETGVSNLLYKAIITEFLVKDTLILSASAYLMPGEYSITINYLKKGGLLRECWDKYEYIKYRSSSGIGDFTVPDNMTFCLWEGFFKAPESDLEISVESDDAAWIWIGDYSNILWMNVLSTERFFIKLTKDQLYYIRVHFFDFGGARKFNFTWRKRNTLTLSSFTTDMLYSPSRPSWNIAQVLSLDDSIDISINDMNYGVYYCPSECMSCMVYLNGEYKCSSCREALVLVDSKCVCELGKGWDSVILKCMDCPERSNRCKYENSLLIELLCMMNFYAVDDVCVESVCYIDLSLHNIMPSSIILLDLVKYCNASETTNCRFEDFHRTKKYQEHSDSLGVLSETSYSLSILSLQQGYLEYQQWGSYNYEDPPIITKKETLNQDLSTYTNLKGRYQGYISLPFTKIYQFSIDTNTEFSIHIQDDSNKVNSYSSSAFSGYFTENEFYFIRIDFTITINTYFKISVAQGITILELTPDFFYYPSKTDNSPIIISACKSIYPFE